MTSETQADTLKYIYKFKFANGTEKKFEVTLDSKSLDLLMDKGSAKPEWTKLKYEQCENCPLADDVEYCPVAVSLSNVVEEFADAISFETASVTVETSERSYVKHSTLQKGLSSLVGVIMATSGCPTMDKLRPMARFHLPFATQLETFYRVLSMYLTAQFIRTRDGKTPDWNLTKLVDIYKNISQVNKGVSRRLSAASNKDANMNALVILHAMGEAIPYYIESGIASLTDFFSTYTRDHEPTEGA